MRRHVLILAAVVLACLLAALVVGEWFVTRPIAAVADATRRLAGGDFSARATLGRGVPGVSELAAALNDMASELEIRDGQRRAAEAALRAAEDQRRHTQKLEAVGQLAAGIAHNFNNLLTVIAGFTQLLLSRSPEGADRGDLMEIDKAARRGAELTRQLLTFSRKHDAQPRTLSIDESVSSMRAMLRSIIRNDVTLTFDFAGEPALVVIDPQELEQVLVNLVLNAVDAEPHGGAIRVSTGVVTIGGEPGRQEIRAAAGRYVRLRVSDTGTGMPPDVLAHLFEPFFTTKEVGQGTGLGLAAVDGIVRSNRGVVTVESTVGEGSTFSVYFPAAPAGARADAADAAGAAPAASAVSEKRGNGETILLIEDEAPVRAIVVRTLERAGYRMLSAAGPLPALEIFEQHAQRIALVVSDIVMPDMHGPAVVEALKAQRPDLRVLFISGYSEETLEDLPPGARLLKKPFAPSALVAAVGEALLAHSAAAR